MQTRKTAVKMVIVMEALLKSWSPGLDPLASAKILKMKHTNTIIEIRIRLTRLFMTRTVYFQSGGSTELVSVQEATRGTNTNMVVPDPKDKVSTMRMYPA